MGISWFSGITAGSGLVAQSSPSSTVLGKFLVDGGWITWFVLVPLSVISIALIIHYLIVLRRSTQVPAGLAKALVSAARRGHARDIVEITREDETMLGQAACAGVLQLVAGRESARAAIDEAVDERATRLFRRIEYLNVIGNIAPMIGLFGTVVGMINAFARIYAAGGGMPDAAKLAGDISVALITTFWGLLIAIPALSIFSLLRNRVDAFAAESVKLCDSLVSLLSEQQTGQTKAAG
jgi:biopolymer transport protein ExbB